MIEKGNQKEKDKYQKKKKLTINALEPRKSKSKRLSPNYLYQDFRAL